MDYIVEYIFKVSNLQSAMRLLVSVTQLKFASIYYTMIAIYE